MRATAFLVLTVLAFSASAFAADSDRCRRYCVKATTEDTAQNVVAFYRLSGWKPNDAVLVQHGGYCAPRSDGRRTVCTMEAYRARLRTDRKGRAEFSFQRAPRERACDVQDGVIGGVGRGPITFRQGQAVRVID